MQKLKMHFPDLTGRNIDMIAELFPAVVTETLDADGNPVRAIDFDALRHELADHIVDGPQERYQFDWPGKGAAAVATDAPTARTLRPVRAESVDLDTTKNLFIEGNNQNFIDQIVWQKKQSRQKDATYMYAMHDHVLVYARHAKADKSEPGGFSINELAPTVEQETNFKNSDGDPRDPWIAMDVTSSKNASERPNLYHPVVNPSTGQGVYPSRGTVWRHEKSSMQRFLDEGRARFGTFGEGFPRPKRFRADIDDGVTPSTWWTREFAGDNQQAKRGIRELFPDFDAFSTPKPVALIKRILDIATGPRTGDTALYFFSGSATAAGSDKEERGGRRGPRIARGSGRRRDQAELGARPGRPLHDFRGQS